MLHRLLMTSMMVIAPVAVNSQTTQPPHLPTEADGDDVIVEALRIPRTKLPTGVYWESSQWLTNKIAQEKKRMFFHCAMKFSDPLTLRRVADGETYSLRAREAQGSIVVRAGGCYPGLPERQGATNMPLSTVDYGSSSIDRGIIIEMILHRYAPDAELTRADTQDAAVQERYRLREYSRNELRLPSDRNSWLFTSCLVREQPVLATRLTRSQPGSALERGLIQALITEGRSCLGGVSRLTVDPTHVRPYVMDAYYRWLVAARNVASLIPVT